MKYGGGRETSLWSRRGPLNSAAAEVAGAMRELRGEVGKLFHNWQANRCAGGLLSFASPLAWMPFIPSDQWDRNKIDTVSLSPSLSLSFWRNFFRPSSAMARKWASFFLAFSPYANRCRADGQPTRIPIEYIKYIRVSGGTERERARSRFVTYECT